MNKIRNIFTALKRRVKFSASDPKNFEVQWSFTASRLQVISLLALLTLIIGFVMTIIIVSSPLAGYFGTDDVSIERSRLERQDKEITRLNKLVAAQEKYARSIQSLILGKDVEEQIDTLVPELASDYSSEISTESTKEEIELAKKVKSDLRTGKDRTTDHKQRSLMAPISGQILSNFNALKRDGVDIAAKKDTPVLSCLAGTVVYAGFSTQEGYVIVIEHADGFVSIYKHAKAVLKKQGDKVQVSDPIAIVGNYGSSFKEPHIHFELWLNQSSVNPVDYIRF
jgi:murein DD-endopeptidase MepM/ murein hydrolase activator NlpD